ncbi:MAG TPA: ScyD/ScyE family protein, partial [Candidatus Limnocylindrales bacterium]|nr:ScyD/ScyE family protein [Candidatus Limnocylindrales bacterium]
DGLPTVTSPEGESSGPVNVAVGPWGKVTVLIGGGPRDLDPRFATVQGAQGTTLADIAAYQATDPDPTDTEGIPGDSNPYGITTLGRGRLLVADAGNNDLLLIGRDGSIQTVARIPPRMVSTAHVGDPNLPPMLPAEAVPTSVTVGPDGYWYVGELTGFPFTPGASRIWRIAPWARNATCDEDTSDGCKLFADGFTSITGLDAGKDGSLYVVEIVKTGVLGLFTGADTTGALFRLKHGHRTEIAPGRFTAPADVAVGDDGILYVTNRSVMPDGEVLSIRR